MYSGGAYGTRLGEQFLTGNDVIGEVVTSANFLLKRVGGQGGFGDISCYIGVGSTDPASDTLLGSYDAAEIDTGASGERITFDSAGATHTVSADDIVYVVSTYNDATQHIAMGFTGTDATYPPRLANEQGGRYISSWGFTMMRKQPNYCVIY